MVHALLLGAAMSLLSDVNRERLAHRLSPVTVDVRLSVIAATHARDMAFRKYFSHETPDGRSPFDRMRAAGCEYRFAGENIAMAPGEPLADAALFASIPHRANTLNPNFTRIGIGVGRDVDGDLLFVEDFSD